MAVAGFEWVLLGFTCFYEANRGFIACFRVLLRFTEFYWVCIIFTRLLLVSTGFYGFFRFLLNLQGF